MNKSDEIILKNRFGVPDKTIARNALDIPERVMEDPPAISAYANIAHEINIKILRGRDQMIMSTIQYIGGAAYEEITVDQDKVIEMLQKSVARKPYNEKCPNCNHYLGVIIHSPYCHHCGQKLDWEGETK